MKKQFKDLDIKWTEQEKFFDHYEFLLSYKWWYALCKVYTDSPCYCKYRLIGTPQYTKCSLRSFVENVSSALLHWFKDWEPDYEQQELQQ
jgi:hypothetical protein